VLVRENEGVAAGQVLFRLDPAPFQVAVAKPKPIWRRPGRI